MQMKDSLDITLNQSEFKQIDFYSISDLILLQKIQVNSINPKIYEFSCAINNEIKSVKVQCSSNEKSYIVNQQPSAVEISLIYSGNIGK